MQQTLDPTSEVVAQAKRHFERFRERVTHLLSFVPDDKLTWTPSPTAKSSLRIVAHCALTCKFCADLITGDMPEIMPSPDEVFKDLNEAEGKITTRTQVISLMNEAATEFCKALDTANTADLDKALNSPFGAMPMQFWMFQGGDQLAGHAGQLEYLQTIWGDLDNHIA